MRGVFSYAFCDFGDHFEVVDINGEELVEVFIADITKVTTLCRVVHFYGGNHSVQLIMYRIDYTLV